MISLNDLYIEACKDAKAEFTAFYPITPATIFMRRASKHFTSLMAEDEIAAINMALGASMSGRKSFIATSGPGLNLMTEALNYAFMAEIPLVVFDFMRAGPGTGIPTKTLENQDISYIENCIFGVTQNPILYPKTQQEIYSQTLYAFAMAEKLKRPVFVLSNFDFSVTYKTPIKLEKNKEHIDIARDMSKRKNFYTGFFTKDGKPSESIPELKKFLQVKADELKRLYEITH